MGHRDIAITTAKLASDVFEATRAMERIEQDGYTRIDPFKIAASEGISVMLQPLDRLYGAFIRGDASGILVNAARSAGLIHMTCAHELGHYFMGHDTAFDETIDYGPKGAIQEQEAESFGYHLLVPRQLLTIICKRKGWNRQSLQNPLILYQLSLRLGVSYAATAWSLMRHKLFDYDMVQQLLKTTPASIKRALMQGPLPDATKEVWLLDDADQSSILEPRPEDHIVVRLKSHASAGYLWLADSVDEAKAEGFVIAPLPASKIDKNGLSFGADATMDYVVSGEDVEFDAPYPLVFTEQRPWVGKQAGDASFNSRAHFEPIAEGLSREAKIVLIKEALLP